MVATGWGWGAGGVTPRGSAEIVISSGRLSAVHATVDNPRVAAIARRRKEREDTRAPYHAAGRAGQIHAQGLARGPIPRRPPGALS